MNKLEYDAANLAFLKSPVPIIEDNEPICDSCIDEGRTTLATVLYLGSYQCSPCALEYVNRLPALAFSGTLESRRERHNARRPS
jgi:hypothetical protein